MIGARVSLPGYDVTDTDPDHFALMADEGYVLIKEKLRGSTSINYTGATPYQITHNLGYIPFFLVYVYDSIGGFNGVIGWKLIPASQLAVVVPTFWCYADTTKLYIYNFQYTDHGIAQTFKWYIFYDELVGSSTLDLSLSSVGMRITKTGYDVLTETNPTNYIFLSDFNTFKILKEGTANITYTADGTYTIAHGLASYTATSFLLFIKFPDGYTALTVGSGWANSKDGAFTVQDVIIDATNITFYLQRNSGTATALQAKYYIFETPLA
jgi:hypothetical protein